MLPSSYTVTVGSTLVGRPSGGNDAVSTVGSNVVGGLVALADRGRGVAAGILSAGGWGDDGHLRDAEGLVVQKNATAWVEDQPGPRTSDEDVRRAVVEERGDEGDALAILEADRLAEAARSVGWWLLGGVGGEGDATATDDRLDPMTLADAEAGAADHRRDSRPDLEQSGKVERATLGAPVGLVVAAAAAFRFRQLARKWWSRSRANQTTKATQPPLWRGPRYMVPAGRRMSRVRNTQRA